MGEFVRYRQSCRAFIIAASMCAVLAACTSGEKQPPSMDTTRHGVLDDDETPPTLPVVGTGTDTAPPLQPGFHPIGFIDSASEPGDTSVRQRMIQPGGWVYAPQESWNSDPATPEIVVRADASPKAPMVAYVDYWNMKDGGFDTRYAVQDSTLQGEMNCVRSEVLGMPAVKTAGSWAQVIYGYTPTGEARLGWVKLVPDKVVFTNEQESLDE